MSLASNPNFRRYVWLPDGSYRQVSWHEYTNEYFRVHHAHPTDNDFAWFHEGDNFLIEDQESVNAALDHIKGQLEPALPDEIHLLPEGKKRVGDHQRAHYAAHLNEQRALGLLNDDEHAARERYVMEQAESLDDLNTIVRDLPPAPRIPRTPAPPRGNQQVDTYGACIDVVGHPGMTLLGLGSAGYVLGSGIAHGVGLIMPIFFIVFFLGLFFLRLANKSGK